MLWAEFKPQQEAELAVVGLGAIFAGIVSGAIPFSTGMATRKFVLGIICGIVAAITGAVFGCFGGLPVALLLAGVIVIVAQVTKPAQRALIAAEEEEYSQFATPFKVSGSKDGIASEGSVFDRKDGSASLGSVFDRDRQHMEKYGFRPAPRRSDSSMQ